MGRWIDRERGPGYGCEQLFIGQSHYVVKDDDTDTSVPVSKTITVYGAALTTDPTDSTETALFIGGTNAGDVINVVNLGSKYQVCIAQGLNSIYSPQFTKPMTMGSPSQ